MEDFGGIKVEEHPQWVEILQKHIDSRSRNTALNMCGKVLNEVLCLSQNGNSNVQVQLDLATHLLEEEKNRIMKHDSYDSFFAKSSIEDLALISKYIICAEYTHALNAVANLEKQNIAFHYLRYVPSLKRQKSCSGRNV